MKPIASIVAGFALLFALCFVCPSSALAQKAGFRVPIRLKIGGIQPSSGSLGYLAEADFSMPLLGVGGTYYTIGYGEFSVRESVCG